MNKEIEIPEGYEAKIEGSKVIIREKESEDERMIKRIIDIFEYDKKHYLKEISWLEKQLEKHKEQPAEWSEEDIDMFGSIRSTLSVYSQNPDTPKEERERCKKDLAWFNELYHRGCPQPHWKPSEEQLSLLQLALNLLEEKCESVPNDLWALYDDLKKLTK